MFCLTYVRSQLKTFKFNNRHELIALNIVSASTDCDSFLLFARVAKSAKVILCRWLTRLPKLEDSCKQIHSTS